jgi:hypothetical protein
LVKREAASTGYSGPRIRFLCERASCQTWSASRAFSIARRAMKDRIVVAGGSAASSIFA